MRGLYLLFILISCSQKPARIIVNQSNSKDIITEFRGSPLKIIEGTKTTPGFKKGVNTLRSFKKLDEFELTQVKTSTNFFPNSTTETNNESLFQANKENSNIQASELYKSFKQVKIKSGVLLNSSLPCSKYNLEFELKDNELFLKKIHQCINGETNSYDVRPIHFSLKDSGDAYSVTFYIKSGLKEFLTSLYFTKKYDTEIQRIQIKNKLDFGDYINPYLYGYNFFTDKENSPYRWQNPKRLKLDLCGDQVDFTVLKENIEKWNQANPMIKITSENIRKDYPPYFDLNNQCLYIINNYKKTRETQIQKTLGISTSTFHLKKNASIIDSDIMIFTEELKEELKNSSYDIEDKNDLSEYLYYEKIVAHEIGHFLGLDHKKNSPLGSIMSYDSSEDSITQYDKSAIDILYNPDLLQN